MNQVTFITVIQELTERDRDLAQIINKLGYPPQWQRQPGFPTLIQIILEQQVSLASALATFKRLNLAVTTLTPATFLSLDDLQLKEIGFSRQKTRYGRELAQAIMEQVLNLDELANLDDLSIRKKLTTIKGIGDWTVDMYLMMALQRLDIFPSKDLAVAIAIQEIKNLPSRPSTKALELIA
ncbi:MAG: DNA-3-methyladenine glycosylase family protein, partial [Waterburya sp.]